MKPPREVASSLLRAMSSLNQGVIGHHRIRVREAAAYILAFTLVVVMVGGFLCWHITNLYQQEMANWRDRQATDADDRTQRVSDWLADRQSEARFFATYPSVRNALRAHCDAGDLPGCSSGSRQELTASLDEIERVYSDARIYVLDRAGHVIARSSRSVPLRPQLTEICRKAPEAGVSRIDLVGKTAEETLLSFSVAVVPEPGTLGVRQAPGQPLGVVLVVLDAAHTLFPLVAREPVPTQTGETILVRREGNDMVYFSPLRHVPISSPDLRFPLSGAPAPAHLALEGRKTVVVYNDYRGVPVLAATQYIPLAAWGLVRKIDLAEALRNYHRMAISEGLAGCLLITILVGLMIFHRRYVLTRVLKQAGEARAHLAAIVESSEDAIIGKRLDGTIASWNRGAERLYGYQAREMMGRSIALLLPPDLSDDLPVILEKINRGEVVEHYETERMRKDGTRVCVSLTVSPLKDAAGAVVGASSIARDITARKRAEEALRDSEIQFRRLFEAAKDGILILDADTGEIKDVNPFLSDLLDFPRADLLGKKLWEIGPLQDALLSRTSFEDLQSKGYVRYEHLPLETRNGKRIEVEFVSNVYNVNQLKVIQCNIRDISARKDAEEHLVQMESRYRGLLEAAPDAMVVVNQGGEIVLLNLQAEKQFGYCRDELVGKNVKSIIPEGFAERLIADALRSVEDALAQQIGTGIELAGRRKNGSDFPIEIMLSPLKSTEGILVTAAIRDITERKRAEEALQKRTRELTYSQEALEGKAQELTRSNTELQQFAYVISHDLQEPLRTMASFAQLLQKRYQGKLDASADDFIHFIVDGATRMQGLIHDLLAYSRVESHGKDFVPTDCTTVFGHALANLQMAVIESGAVVTHDPLPTVQGDGVQLIQVFQNLVGNGLKFRDSRPPRVHVAAEQRPSEWVFSVKDNGIGIDPQYAHRIFEVFQRLHNRTEYPGSGIGLAITKRIVERHGGRIWVESRPHQGATFFFTLPA
jgi:PAS domain S-box-containing protein